MRRKQCHKITRADLKSFTNSSALLSPRETRRTMPCFLFHQNCDAIRGLRSGRPKHGSPRPLVPTLLSMPAEGPTKMHAVIYLQGPANNNLMAMPNSSPSILLQSSLEIHSKRVQPASRAHKRSHHRRDAIAHHLNDVYDRRWSSFARFDSQLHPNCPPPGLSSPCLEGPCSMAGRRRRAKETGDACS